MLSLLHFSLLPSRSGKMVWRTWDVSRGARPGGGAALEDGGPRGRSPLNLSEMSGTCERVVVRRYLWLITSKVYGHLDPLLVIRIAADKVQRGKVVFCKIVCLLRVLIHTR